MNKTILVSIDGLAAYYLEENFADLPNIQSVIKNGHCSLNVETVYPSLTWNIHASVLTGLNPKDHGIIGNWAFDKSSMEAVNYLGENYDSEKILNKKTIYDIAKDSGMSTAAVCWPLTRGATSIDCCIPEFYEQELFEKYSSSDFWNGLKTKGFPVVNYGVWSKDHKRGPMQDKLTADIACYLIENKNIDFMMLHFLLPDSFQHDYGVKTAEVRWALEYIDGLLGKIFCCLKINSIFDKTNIVLFSDHGFQNINRYFLPNMLFKKKGWYYNEKSKKNQVTAVSAGGCGLVYLNNQKLKQKVFSLLKSANIAEKIFLPEDFHKLGLPEPFENPLMADIIFECKDGIAVDVEDTKGEWLVQSKYKAMHGYLPSKKEMKSIFAAFGPDFPDYFVYPQFHITDICKLIYKRIFNNNKNAGKELNLIL